MEQHDAIMQWSMVPLVLLSKWPCFGKSIVEQHDAISFFFDPSLGLTLFLSFRKGDPVKWSEVAKSGEMTIAGCAAYGAVHQQPESHDYEIPENYAVFSHRQTTLRQRLCTNPFPVTLSRTACGI